MDNALKINPIVSNPRMVTKIYMKAVKQAIGMLKASGLWPEKLLELFLELKGACDAFIQVLKENLGESKKFR